MLDKYIAEMPYFFYQRVSIADQDAAFLLWLAKLPEH